MPAFLLADGEQFQYHSGFSTNNLDLGILNVAAAR
jgi:hypothetical protein